MNRRDLLKYMALSAASIPSLLSSDTTLIANKGRKHLILIELKGGNDGLNTLIPYSDPIYYKLRPELAIDRKEVLPLNESFGLHPSLKGLKKLYDKGQLAIVQGIGYPNPNRSHFRSIDIWDTASKSDEYLDEGWISKLKFTQEVKISGVVLGGEIGPLTGIDGNVVMIKNIKGFVNRSRQIKSNIHLTQNNEAYKHILKTQTEISQSADLLRQYMKNKKEKFNYVKGDFGRQLNVATQLISAGADIPYFKLTLKGFDTHFNQKNKHANLLKILSDGIYELKKHLVKLGKWDETVVMTYSEFGRRAGENASQGSDHGTAAPHFIVGGRIEGGLYGKAPSLDDLDENGDLKYTTDFRDYYKMVAGTINLTG